MNLSVVVLATDNTSSWMKPLSFVEYTTKSAGMTYLNGTFYSATGGFDKPDPVVFKWTCIESNETTAKLQITLDFGKNENILHFTNTIFVNLANRAVYLLNGTFLGTTRFWSVTNPVQYENIVFWDYQQEKIFGTLDIGDSSNKIYFSTPQGVQRSYFLGANGTIRGESYSTLPYAYDFDTGICIVGFFNNEPMLLALGIKNVMGGAELVNTNFDLGPQEITFTIRSVLPFIVVIIVTLIIFIAVYMRLSKKQVRHRKHSFCNILIQCLTLFTYVQSLMPAVDRICKKCEQYGIACGDV